MKATITGVNVRGLTDWVGMALEVVRIMTVDYYQYESEMVVVCQSPSDKDVTIRFPICSVRL